MGKTVAIIQARCGSARLPNKVMANICGHPMLWHVVTRTKAAKSIDEVVVATTMTEKNLPIYRLASQCGWALYGTTVEEGDVLTRYYEVAKMMNADPIVRITADCPLIDPDIIDTVVGVYFALRPKVDYLGTGKGYPDGYDTEVFSFGALDTAYTIARRQYDREHVTPYMKKYLDVDRVERQQDCDVKLSVDYPEDLERIRWVYGQLYKEGEIFHLEDVLGLLNS